MIFKYHQITFENDFKLPLNVQSKLLPTLKLPHHQMILQAASYANKKISRIKRT